MMKITVKKLQGGQCVLDVLPTTSITEIKQNVFKNIGIPVEEQKLLLLGRTLADDKAVGFYPLIKDGTKLNLVVKKPEGLYEVSMKLFKKQGMSDRDATNTANRLLKIIQDKFDKLSLDDIDKLSLDCLMNERELRGLPIEKDAECENM